MDGNINIKPQQKNLAICMDVFNISITKKLSLYHKLKFSMSILNQQKLHGGNIYLSIYLIIQLEIYS